MLWVLRINTSTEQLQKPVLWRWLALSWLSNRFKNSNRLATAEKFQILLRKYCASIKRLSRKCFCESESAENVGVDVIQNHRLKMEIRTVRRQSQVSHDYQFCHANRPRVSNDSASIVGNISRFMQTPWELFLAFCRKFIFNYQFYFPDYVSYHTENNFDQILFKYLGVLR